MKIVKVNKSDMSQHEHYVLSSDSQTVGGTYNEIIEKSPFGTLENLDVSVHRASTMATLAMIRMDGIPVNGGFPPDISRLCVDRVIGTKDKIDGGWHHHIMIYV